MTFHYGCIRKDRDNTRYPKRSTEHGVIDVWNNDRYVKPYVRIKANFSYRQKKN